MYLKSQVQEATSKVQVLSCRWEMSVSLCIVYVCRWVHVCVWCVCMYDVYVCTSVCTWALVFLSQLHVLLLVLVLVCLFKSTESTWCSHHKHGAGPSPEAWTVSQGQRPCKTPALPLLAANSASGRAGSPEPLAPPIHAGVCASLISVHSHRATIRSCRKSPVWCTPPALL